MVVFKQSLTENNYRADYVEFKKYSLTKETAYSSPQNMNPFNLNYV
jgi:hypothetical protein